MTSSTNIILRLVLFELGTAISTQFSSLLLVPLQIVQVFGNQSKNLILGITNGLLGLISVIVAPIIGHVSDMEQVRMPYIVVGTVIWSVMLVFRGAIRDTTLLDKICFFSSMFVSKLAYHTVNVPFNALLPEYIARENIGKVSGLIISVALIGAFLAVVLFSWMFAHVSWVIICLLAAISPVASLFVFCSMPNKVQVQDAKPIQKQTASREKSRICKFNFVFAFWGLFMVYGSAGFIHTFMLYLLKDLIHPNYTLFSIALASTPEQAQAILFATTLFLSVVASLCSGWIADRIPHGRKWLITIAVALACLDTFLIFAFRQFQFMLLTAVFAGISFGLLQSNATAIATRIADPENAAQDLAVLGIAKTVSLFTTSPIAGFIIDWGNSYQMGTGYLISHLCSNMFVATSCLCFWLVQDL